jgi:hypothetical protein
MVVLFNVPMKKKHIDIDHTQEGIDHGQKSEGEWTGNRGTSIGRGIRTTSLPSHETRAERGPL